MYDVRAENLDYQFSKTNKADSELLSALFVLEKGPLSIKAKKTPQSVCFKFFGAFILRGPF
jgi:hypothetical protein